MRIFILSFIFCAYCQAQNEVVYFNQSYWADSMNIFSTIIEPIEDGYLIMGPYVSTNYDALYIRKINKKGETIWFKNIEENIYAGTIETGRQVARIDERTFAVTYSYYYETDSVWTILSKFDTLGNVIFKKEYHTSKLFRNTRQLITTEDKGFAFVGSRRQIEPLENNTFYLFKTDSLGNKEWERTYSFEGFISVTYSIQQTPDGGYILGGYTNTGSTNKNKDMYILKTDSLGNKEWDKRIGGGWDDCPAIVHCLTTTAEYQQTGKIEYLISGCYIDEFSSAENRYEIYLFKLGTEGQLLWEQGHNPYSIMHRLRVQVIMPDKSFYGVGVRSENLYWSPVLYRFNAQGELLWKKELLLDSLASYYIRDMQLTEDGGFVLAGFRNIPHPQHSWVLKMDSLGNTCMPADCDSTVLITNIEDVPISKDMDIGFQLYPNPSSQFVKVAFEDTHNEGKHNLTLFNLEGQKVAHYQVSSLQSIDIGNLESGMYYAQLEGFRALTKLLIIN